MSGYDSTGSKRRRVGTATANHGHHHANDLDYAYVAHPTTSRTKAAAAQAAAAAQQQAAQAAAQAQHHHHSHSHSQSATMSTSGGGASSHHHHHHHHHHSHSNNGPIISFAALPTTALQRYLTRYGLLETQGSISYHHSVFPVPPLPATLFPPLEGRSLNTKNAQRTYVPARRKNRKTTTTTMAGVDDNKVTTTMMMLQREWTEPKTQELTNLTAFDDSRSVNERLAKRAAQHWDKRDSVKEGETLTNFMFSVRMRDKNLKAIPPASL